MIKKLFIILFLCSCSKVSLNWQNDIVGGTDHQFSNGFELKYRPNPEDLNKDVAKALGNLPTFTKEESLPAYTFSIRQDIYTPDDLAAREVILDDNPYAGSLTFDTEKVVISEAGSKISSKFRLGTSGEPSLAGQTQKFVHDGLTDLGRPNQHPNGWSHQIDAEPLTNFDHNREVELGRADFGGGISTSTEAGLLTRLGNINTDLTTSITAKVGYNLPQFKSLNLENKFSTYLYSSLFTSGVARNLYYDGGIYRNSEHTVQSEDFVTGAEAGLITRYKNYEVGVRFNIRSREFEEQKDDYHTVGYISLGVSW